MAIDLSTTARLMAAIRMVVNGGSSASQTIPAVCTRVDNDGTAWVRAIGSDEDTPVDGASIAVVEAGDWVNLDVREGSATIVGNVSNPSVGNVQLERVSAASERMGKALEAGIDTAHNIADAAQSVASAINQHFWTDTDGVHVTQVSQEEWQDYEGTNYQSGQNVLINSLGQLFRDGLNNLLTMTTESGARALAIWDGTGNAASNVLASFGEVVRIGKSAAMHVLIDSDSIDMMSGAQLLTSIIGVNANNIVGGRMLFNGGSKVDGTYNYEGTSYASRELHMDAGNGSNNVASSVAMRALTSGNASDIPYVSVESDGSITGRSTSSRFFKLAKTGVAATLVAPSADMTYGEYDSEIQLRLPSSTSARVRVASSTSETNVYNDHVTIKDSSFTGYAYPDRVIVNGDGGSVSLRIGNTYEGVYDDDNSVWIIGKNKTTGAIQVNGQAMPVIKRGTVGQTNTVTAGSYKDVSVSFNYTYGSAPTVVVGLNSNSTSSDLGQCSVSVAAVTTTGFTARLFNNSSSDRSPGFYWIAVW